MSYEALDGLLPLCVLMIDREADPNLQTESQARPGSAIAMAWAALFKPVDIASLVFFRISFGVICFWHVWIQLPSVKLEYIDAKMLFTYLGFDWVRPLPGDWIYLVFLVMAIATICIAIGFYYRVATVAFFLLHTYVFLLDQSNYWNHYYLITLIAFLMIFIPANRSYSLDVYQGRLNQFDDVPAWTLWSLRAQMAFTYFFSGLAKLNGDWLQGNPMGRFMAGQQDFPLIGRWFHEQWMVLLFSWGALVLELAIVPLLLWRRTRAAALVLAIGFHLANTQLFDIMVFPWLAIAATLLFLPPHWPRFGGQWRRAAERQDEQPRSALPQTVRGKAIVALLSVYFLIQATVPLRHYLYPGRAEWTFEGYLFSWRMMAADKQGYVRFFVYSNGSDVPCEVDVRQYIQRVPAKLLAQRPDMMVQFAHHIRDEWKTRGRDVRVHAFSYLEFNGRSGRALVDQSVDLASVTRTLGHYGFLTELDKAEPATVPVTTWCEVRPTVGQAGPMYTPRLRDAAVDPASPHSQ